MAIRIKDRNQRLSRSLIKGSFYLTKAILVVCFFATTRVYAQSAIDPLESLTLEPSTNLLSTLDNLEPIDLGGKQDYPLCDESTDPDHPNFIQEIHSCWEPNENNDPSQPFGGVAGTLRLAGSLQPIMNNDEDPEVRFVQYIDGNFLETSEITFGEEIFVELVFVEEISNTLPRNVVVDVGTYSFELMTYAIDSQIFRSDRGFMVIEMIDDGVYK